MLRTNDMVWLHPVKYRFALSSGPTISGGRSDILKGYLSVYMFAG